MNRKMRRASMLEGRRAQTRPWNTFHEITRTEAALRAPSLNFNNFEKVWQNNHYVVFLSPRKKLWMDVWWDRVMCRRSDAQPIFSWSDLFRVKNELFGEETEAIQFYPKKSELVDDANLYWFFLKSGDQ